MDTKEITIISPEETYCLYTDGSYFPLLGMVGLGGVIKNSQNEKIASFSLKINTPTKSTNYELQALEVGLQKASELGIKNLICYTDFYYLVHIFEQNKYRSTAFSEQVEKTISNYKELFRNLKIAYVPREKNAEADNLARKSVGKNSRGNERNNIAMRSVLPKVEKHSLKETQQAKVYRSEKINSLVSENTGFLRKKNNKAKPISEGIAPKFASPSANFLEEPAEFFKEYRALDLGFLNYQASTPEKANQVEPDLNKWWIALNIKKSATYIDFYFLSSKQKQKTDSTLSIFSSQIIPTLYPSVDQILSTINQELKIYKASQHAGSTITLFSQEHCSQFFSQLCQKSIGYNSEPIEEFKQLCSNKGFKITGLKPVQKKVIHLKL